MERNHIEELLPGAFNTLHSLKEVFLRGNNIEELSPGVFNSLSELEILDLSENNLKTLGANCLAGTIHLKSLNLSSNFLVTFNESILDQNIAEIEYIDMSFNRITDISIGNIEHKIINIDLSSNRISTMNFCISEFVSVNVSRNLLKSLGKISCSNTNSRLISLDMSFNNISELFSDSFINSTQLKILNFQHNNISSLPIGLFSHLSNLEDLNLANNSLEQFYHGILEGLEKLRILDISNNKFITIKRYLHSLVNLRELYIQRNKIKSLDSEQLIRDLPHLSNISLDGNNFTCDDLIEIIHDLRSKSVNIAYGDARNTSNVHGISCLDNSNVSTGFSENIGSNLEKIILNKLGQLSNQESNLNDMHEYFNSDFKKSNFYQYLENMREQKSLRFNDSQIYKFFNQDFENTKFYKYLKNLTDAENITIEFNKNVYDYFDKDFKNSSFVKYLENLQNAENILDEEISKSVMNKYFNEGFEQSRFYNYLEKLKVNPEFYNSSGYLYDKKFDSYVITEETNILLILTVILLIIVSGILGILTYIIFENLSRKKRNSEQVELIDA
nr:leucine-rich repeat-containing protein 15-like [Leptinotarsa decemlineata]